MIERYETGVAEKLQAWDGKTSRQKYAKDEEYLKFKSRIFVSLRFYLALAISLYEK